MQRINYTEAEQLWVLDELTSLMVSNITDVSFVDGDLAWCGHLRPSLSVLWWIYLARQFSGRVGYQRMVTFSRANDSGSPIGEWVWWAGIRAPSNSWLICRSASLCKNFTIQFLD